MAKRVAILGWGNLNRGLENLRLADGAWHGDGPVLPIEFARTPSTDMAPVLCAEQWTVYAQTLWSQSSRDDVVAVSKNLAESMGIAVGQIQTSIGYLDLDEGNGIQTLISANGARDVTNETLQRIGQWLAINHFDAAVWMDDRPLWVDATHGAIPATVDGLVAYFNGLTGDALERAQTNLVRAPAQVWTAVRSRLAAGATWPAKARTPWIRTPDDPRFREWEQCWTTIGQLDTILVDLRKLGFSFIVALLSATAYLGFFGIGSAQGVSLPATARGSAFVAIMALVVALFLVDSYYQVLHCGATERALDLEALTDPPIRAAKYLSVNATVTFANPITFGLYLGLLLIATGLGVLAVLVDTSTQTPTLKLGAWNPTALGVSIVGAAFIVIMGLYWWFVVSRKTGLLKDKPGRQWRAHEGPHAKIASPEL